MPTSTSTSIELQLLLDAIFLKYNYDFRHYSKASIIRRLEQALAHFKLTTLSALQDRLLHDPVCFRELLRYLTIPVSEMFRDPSYFLRLREEVVPILKTYPSIKIWVAGCSTGEEVVSLAILLHEEELLERTLIYATDINPHSLQAAEAGVYPLTQMKRFTENYLRSGGRRSLSDYYTAAYGAALFEKSLRKNVTYADHSLATDSVFSEVQMISCRNVLIYFEDELQSRALGLFHESLSHRGFLGLGSQETLRFTPFADRFESFAAEDRLYRKK